MEIVLLIGMIVIVGGLIWLGFNFSKISERFLMKKEDEQDLNKQITDLSQNMTSNLNSVTKNLLDQLNAVTKQVNERLKENSEMTQRSQRSLGERLDNAAKVVSTVTGKLSKLEEANKKIFDVGKDIASLQEILRAPKLRGTLGELFLGDLLSQVFAKEHYKLQYTFKSGAMIDAVICLRDNQLVPIDAKFPLENFKKMIKEEDEKAKRNLKKLFKNDVKKHINDIAEKYILPDEGTLDFALMYIPAENVYYETIIKDDEDLNIIDHALKKKVIPVSPNSFYVYIQSILMGLRGMQIEKQAKEIWMHLSSLRTDFVKFEESFAILGKHLNHARNSYDNSGKRLSRFNDKLLATGKKPEEISGKDEKVTELPLPE